MDWSWITTSLSSAVMGVLSAVGIFTALVVFTRLVGLRSFSKMSSFDFAHTIAVGSLLATVVLTKDPPLLLGIVMLGTLQLLQFFVSLARRRFPLFRKIADNQPILLMAGGNILEDNLRSTHVSESEILAKLREANVLCFSQVRAVVMETTGDISVLHGDESSPPLDRRLLAEVRDVDRLTHGHSPEDGEPGRCDRSPSVKRQ